MVYPPAFLAEACCNGAGEGYEIVARIFELAIVFFA